MIPRHSSKSDSFSLCIVYCLLLVLAECTSEFAAIIARCVVRENISPCLMKGEEIHMPSTSACVPVLINKSINSFL